MQLLDRKIHMIGIGGTGMSSAARLLLARGCTVSGSDCTATEVTSELATLGAEVRIGHHPENIPPGCDLVVATAAAAADNPEITQAKSRALPVMKYAEMLGLLMDERIGVAVAGTHGKTTTSSMVVEVLRAGGFSPSYVIGGKIATHRGSDCAGRGAYLVAEACEYDRSFLNLRPLYAILTNVEPDHLDYYKTEQNMVEAYCEFVRQIPPEGLLVVCGDCEKALYTAGKARCSVMTYGVSEHCDWKITTVETEGQSYTFKLCFKGRSYNFTLPLPGHHNVLNGAGCAALALELGVTPDALQAGLSSFRGVQRRFDVLTDGLPVTVVDDYAHHPTEIGATLRAAREKYPGRRIWAVYQAHQHSRTRAFFEEFARSLTYADRVTIAKIYSVRETEMDRMSVNGGDLAGRLFQLSINSDYISELEDIESMLLSETQDGDVVVVMGAGDIYKVAHSVAAALSKRATHELSNVETPV